MRPLSITSIWLASTTVDRRCAMIRVVRFWRDRIQFGLNRFFRFRVERGSRFVENQYCRIFQNGARDRHALFFAAGQFQASFATGVS